MKYYTDRAGNKCYKLNGYKSNEGDCVIALYREPWESKSSLVLTVKESDLTEIKYHENR